MKRTSKTIWLAVLLACVLTLGPLPQAARAADANALTIAYAPEDEAMALAYNVMRKGAHGVDMGRNIFQSEHPVEMAMAVGKIVHEGFTDKEALEFFQDAIHS